MVGRKPKQVKKFQDENNSLRKANKSLSNQIKTLKNQLVVADKTFRLREKHLMRCREKLRVSRAIRETVYGKFEEFIGLDHQMTHHFQTLNFKLTLQVDDLKKELDKEREENFRLKTQYIAGCDTIKFTVDRLAMLHPENPIFW
jgi:erythromycin esterase-like protein